MHQVALVIETPRVEHFRKKTHDNRNLPCLSANSPYKLIIYIPWNNTVACGRLRQTSECFLMRVFFYENAKRDQRCLLYKGRNMPKRVKMPSLSRPIIAPRYGSRWLVSSSLAMNFFGFQKQIKSKRDHPPKFNSAERHLWK